MENTELKVYDENGNKLIANLTSERNISFCSMVANTVEEKKQLFNVMNNPDYRISDFINKKIKVKDLFVEVVELVDETTGELKPVPRIVAIDDKGKGYTCCSLGMYGAFKKLIATFGVPTWEKPIEIEIKQIKKGAKSLLSIELV